MADLFKLETNPSCHEGNVIQGEKYRFTLLTDRLVRMEYCEDGVFEDLATQVVLNRNFPQVSYTVKDSDDQLEIYTKYMQLIYNKKAFSSNGLSIKVQGYKFPTRTWHYGENIPNLKGTARTLDDVNGACELDDGVMSVWGCAVLDDSKSLLIDERGWVKPRGKEVQDLYFFAYGHDYRECLNDFYYLCGKTPMLPRFALGNWWSRYYKYTEQSYMELMEKFDSENVPFSVAVIDMDWHLVDIDPKYGTGWTGYTWNRDFFPDPERFLNWLHARGMKTTLNVHPADGIRGHEEMYPQMAEAMGIDPTTEEPVNFDIADPDFLEKYFKVVHHPMEEQGVDFWWIDWQQGGITKVEGLDPLWMLNHFHYLDSGRDGKRPMTFSRYAGPGSHRYPVGFSGDTHMTWDSLDFQPYFTSTASNIGYGWWSHDIGGHMFGERNEEMAGRWLQLGVFSPIMRLHSSENIFLGKEPWLYKMDIHHMMNEFLRLRHQMIPYLYTMNYRAYKENMPLVQPMYYGYPNEASAYKVKNQYFFGTELIVAPITTPCISGINKAKVNVWLPEGIYFDFFTGMTYQGGKNLEMYRDMSSLPVLAKAGAIVPLTEEISANQAQENPNSFVLNVFAGADGNFTMYEDDNKTCDYLKNICAKTRFVWNWNRESQQNFIIQPAEGELSLIPEKRTWTMKIYGCEKPEAELKNAFKVCVDGEEKEAEISYDYMKKCMTIDIPEVEVTSEVNVVFSEKLELAENRMEEEIFEFLKIAEIGNTLKSDIYELFKKEKTGKDKLSVVYELKAMGIDENLFGCLMEYLN